jgi:diketogulonate reductase-like aldo/keto reductase
MNLKTVSGNPVHPIGIGTWGIGGTWEAVYGNEQTGMQGIRYSISKGQNHIDSGQIYGAGHTDEVIGQAIKDIKRKDLYITDKIWETSVANGKVWPAVETMLNKLGTDYLDALYIHKPWDDFPWREAIPQIDSLIDKGIVRHFGVSNFTIAHMKETQQLSKHPIVLNQLYFNILHKQDANTELLKFCGDNNIQTIAYRPLERGEVQKNEIVKHIAKVRSVTPTQIALAWLLAKQTMPIPGALEEQFIDQNIAAIDIKLTPEEIAQLDDI